MNTSTFRFMVIFKCAVFVKAVAIPLLWLVHTIYSSSRLKFTFVFFSCQLLRSVAWWTSWGPGRTPVNFRIVCMYFLWLVRLTGWTVATTQEFYILKYLFSICKMWFFDHWVSCIRVSWKDTTFISERYFPTRLTSKLLPETVLAFFNRAKWALSVWSFGCRAT